MPIDYGSGILNGIGRLIELFEPHCDDHSTLAVIKEMLEDRYRRPEAKALFEEIRSKTLKVEKTENRQALCQYLFEEVCAKTFYNFTHPNAPFDSDTPYWIIPNAIHFARQVGISDAECIDAIMG